MRYANQFALDRVEVFDAFGRTDGRTKKAEQVDDRLEGVVNLVRDRGCHSASRGDFFGLQQGFLEPPAPRDVSKDFGRPDDLSIYVEYWRYGEGDIDELPGLCDSCRFEVLNAAAGAQTFNDH